MSPEILVNMVVIGVDHGEGDEYACFQLWKGDLILDSRRLASPATMPEQASAVAAMLRDHGLKAGDVDRMTAMGGPLAFTEAMVKLMAKMEDE